MDQCKKHDDQMSEWIMCLKAAKEIWDEAFLKDDRYEVGVVPKLIFALAKEIYQERLQMRYTVLHKESGGKYSLGADGYRIDLAGPAEGAMLKYQTGLREKDGGTDG